MAIDWEKINNKAKELEERADFTPRGPAIKFWNPKSGSNIIRVLPPWTNEGDHADVFFREVAQHWGLSSDSKAPVLCKEKTPYLNGKCAACDLVNDLRKDKTDATAQQLAKDHRAKSAYLFSIIDRADPEYTAADIAAMTKGEGDEDLPAVGDMKVQVFPANFTVFQGVMAAMTSDKLDITDPKEGHDITIKKTGSGQFGTSYSVITKIKPSPVGGNYKLVDLSQVGFTLDDDDMLDALSKGKMGDYLVGALPAPKAAAELTSGAENSVPSEDLRAMMKAAAEQSA